MRLWQSLLRLTLQGKPMPKGLAAIHAHTYSYSMEQLFPKKTGVAEAERVYEKVIRTKATAQATPMTPEASALVAWYKGRLKPGVVYHLPRDIFLAAAEAFEVAQLDLPPTPDLQAILKNK